MRSLRCIAILLALALVACTSPEEKAAAAGADAAAAFERGTAAGPWTYPDCFGDRDHVAEYWMLVGGLSSLWTR